jgi:hypothetical protein
MIEPLEVVFVSSFGDIENILAPMRYYLIIAHQLAMVCLLTENRSNPSITHVSGEGLISAPVLWSRLDYIINNDIKNLRRTIYHRIRMSRQVSSS